MIAHIFTGPPGSGKSTLAERKHLPIFDRDLGNLPLWEAATQDICITVTAPTHKQKDDWLRRVIDKGFDPRLYVIWTDRMRSHQRAADREVRNERHTFKWIEFWYKNYSRHPQEERIENEARA